MCLACAAAGTNAVVFGTLLVIETSRPFVINTWFASVRRMRESQSAICASYERKSCCFIVSRHISCDSHKLGLHGDCRRDVLKVPRPGGVRPGSARLLSRKARNAPHHVYKTSKNPSFPSSASHGNDFVRDRESSPSFENTKQFGATFTHQKVGARPRVRNMAGAQASPLICAFLHGSDFLPSPPLRLQCTSTTQTSQTCRHTQATWDPIPRTRWARRRSINSGESKNFLCTIHISHPGAGSATQYPRRRRLLACGQLRPRPSHLPRKSLRRLSKCPLRWKRSCISE